MNIAYISALSALGGSVIGGFTLGVTNWLNQNSQARAERLAHDFEQRGELYKDFILAASRAYGEAVVSSVALLSKFGPVVLMDFGPPPVPQPTVARVYREAWRGLESQSGFVRAAASGA